MLAYPGKRAARPHQDAGSDFRFETMLTSSADDGTQIFDNLGKAVKAALAARQTQNDVRQGLLFELTRNGGLKPEFIIDHNMALPGGIHVSELAANYLAVHHGEDFQLNYMGLDPEKRRIFALRERG